MERDHDGRTGRAHAGRSDEPLSALADALSAEDFGLGGAPVVLETEDEFRTLWEASVDGAALARLVERVAPRVALAPAACACARAALPHLADGGDVARRALDVAERCREGDAAERADLRAALRKTARRAYVEAVDRPRDQSPRNYATHWSASAVIAALDACDPGSERGALAAAVVCCSMAEFNATAAAAAGELSGGTYPPAAEARARSLAASANLVRAMLPRPSLAHIEHSRRARRG